MVDTSIEVKRVHKLDTGSTLKAFVDIVVANVVLIKGLRIVHGKNGLFVSMPRKQGKDGQWYPEVYPLNDEIKTQLNRKVLEAYQEL